MNLLEALLLGLVQGLTEFLPVSSSGHLVIGQALLGIDASGVTFEVFVHLATVCAVLWVYRARILHIAAGVGAGRREDLTYVGLLALASIPAGIAGFFGRPLFEQAFGNPTLAALLLLVTGAVVWSVRASAERATADRPDAGRALGIGVAQAVSIFPGISRSGATVAMGAWLGVEVEKMAEFSFLMAIPAILGAGLTELGQAGNVEEIGAGVLGAGFAAAAVSGVLAIKLFVWMLREGTFHRFAYYCWAAGGLYLFSTIV